jgi:phosphoribosyl-ATP pyrophosphohydrolase/phosphoribosyl-AMP cyclohydrolase
MSESLPNGRNEPVPANGAVAFDARGLVPVVTQDRVSGEVLMLAYANAEALRLTLETGRAHYYSRSRNALWRKGDTSGNVQLVSEVSLDCDGDAVLYRVTQRGPACHTGSRSCFFTTMPVAGAHAESSHGPEAGEDSRPGSAHDRKEPVGRAMALLEQVIAQRLRDLPEGSYVTRLHSRGLGYMAQKVVEEAGETVVAALERRDDQLIDEAADLLFHLAVLLRERGHGFAPVAAKLEERHRRGGDG